MLWYPCYTSEHCCCLILDNQRVNAWYLGAAPCFQGGNGEGGGSFCTGGVNSSLQHDAKRVMNVSSTIYFLHRGDVHSRTHILMMMLS